MYPLVPPRKPEDRASRNETRASATPLIRGASAARVLIGVFGMLGLAGAALATTHVTQQLREATPRVNDDLARLQRLQEVFGLDPDVAALARLNEKRLRGAYRWGLVLALSHGIGLALALAGLV